MEHNICDTIIPTLVAAVETVMNPDVAHSKRLEAHKICENFKESSPFCLQCGLELSQQQYPPILRHFGLQLIEYCVKFRWNNLTHVEKDLVKINSLQNINKGTCGILYEELHIKDGIARIVVEVIKREWPQCWPTLLKDLHTLSLSGETQTELVLKVFHRLVEDIVVFCRLPNHRRREVLQALTAHMSDLFQFFYEVLDLYTNKFHTLSSSELKQDKEAAMAACRVSEAVLTTLTGFVDWVNMSFIMESGGCFLKIICMLLSDDALQLLASECLLLIVSRKGKLDERKPLLLLFSEEAMTPILTAAGSADQSPQSEKYIFLKRLCQLLTELGKQLCALWGSTEHVGQPMNFDTYLEALMAFSKHPSQMLGSYTQSLWVSFLRHEQISQNALMKEYLPRIIRCSMKTLLKIGFPSQSNSQSCDYARLDFDSDEEFSMFFSRYRADTCAILRQATLLDPKVSFSLAMEWLQSQLQKPIDTGGAFEFRHCNLNSPSFLEWDALTVFLECVMTRLPLSDKNQPDLSQGMVLLHNVLKYETQDPLILSCLMSCVSAFFPFVTERSDIVLVLEKIFGAVGFSLVGQTKGTRSRGVKNVRQHACSILVKICRQNTDLLFPVFDLLYSNVKKMSEDPEQLSQMEKCILMEALILVSNKFNNFEKQSSFIEEVLQPVKELWMSPNFTKAFIDSAKFMSYVGLDQAPVEPSSADTCGINRSHISYCISMILAVMKRSKWPDNETVAAAGGFVSGTLSDGSFILKNPATSHIRELLNNLLALLKASCQLWLPQFLSLRHPDYALAYDLQENDKFAILGIPPPCTDNTSSTKSKHPLERMQNFLTTVFENGFHILGNAGLCLGYEFYTAPNLAQYLLESIFNCVQNMPDYRFKPIIRVFMKPFVQNCPKECLTTAVIPVLSKLCPYMLDRLGSRWQEINQMYDTAQNGNEKEQEETEVIEDQLTRQLTREYIELLGIMCFTRRGHVESVVSDEMDMEDDSAVAASNSNRHSDNLSELGQLCMRTDGPFPAVFLCVFVSLSWNDTATCNKCSTLCLPMLKQVVANNMMTAEAAANVFSCVLAGLQVHGQHESCQAQLLFLGLQVYEVLRPLFPEISTVLLQIPHVTEHVVKSFDEKILPCNPQKQISEKKKKEAFKCLVYEIIGKNVGQKFQREIHYKTLPPMFRKKQKQPSLDDVEKKDMGLCELFKSEPSEVC
ncbi:LOW QUALITY PROTEIN: exportin-5-like [Gigantopelta aegis]|uniref:LOW QUALITY PROTEIN: exportin-5-like n=1 Tax=Gigantopelta aegis TaxID=1735272 RepID=UPI001B88CB76|nr:LOW QUALITY PROTEIN: exportin-5-like [Gigantopelta aegis]